MSVTGAIMAVGAIGSAVVGAVGASEASNAQQSAAQQAEAFQKSQSALATGFQTNEWTNQQANEAPFLAAGVQGTNELATDMAPGGDLSKQWTGSFTAPTAQQASQTPGYQFAMQQGQQALQRSAAAQGNLLSGGTAKDLTRFAQGTADSNYQQTYNNALTQYSTAYNQFQQAQQNKYSRLTGLANIGQTAAGQLGSEGQAAATNIGNIDMTTGAQVGQDLTNIGNAKAMGDIGIANSIGTGLRGLGSAAAVSQMPTPGSLNGPNLNAVNNLPVSGALNPSLYNAPNVAPPIMNASSYSSQPVSSMLNPYANSQFGLANPFATGGF